MDDPPFITSFLMPFTKYSIRLFTSNELGVSRPSEVITFKTLEEAPTGAPENVRVISLEPDSLTISWKAPHSKSINGEIRGYVISIRKQNIGGEVFNIVRPALRQEVQPDLEEYVVRDLHPNTLYEISVQVFNKVGTGPSSSPRVVQATRFEAPECPPEGVSCKGDLSGIRVWWEPASSRCS
ncbi:Down syndrome cell adhesion molecule-like protein 1-like protein [Armadillidium vulgare]|nr:Down syndrome cell adhesion molecule-like protein 1-like protein [Armadillidium vulgare]